MLIGHLAPIGPIAATVERHWKPDWPRWARALPWAAALAGSVFPDLDVMVNILLTGTVHHLYYWPHSILLYLPLLALGLAFVCWRRTRLAGALVLTFGGSVVTHLLLDTISHGTLLFYPLSWRVVGWTFPPAGETMLVSYLRSPNFWLEPGVIGLVVVWWLRRGVCARGRGRRITPAYLAAMPRHEGSRPLRLDHSRWVTRTSTPPRG